MTINDIQIAYPSTSADRTQLATSLFRGLISGLVGQYEVHTPRTGTVDASPSLRWVPAA
jgi:hypothetical protein